MPSDGAVLEASAGSARTAAHCVRVLLSPHSLLKQPGGGTHGVNVLRICRPIDHTVPTGISLNEMRTSPIFAVHHRTTVADDMRSRRGTR